jgi:hypothetical protein
MHINTHQAPLGLRRRLILASLAGMGTSAFGLTGCARDETKSVKVALPMANTTIKASTLLLVEVWKTPNCGCCKLWVAHLEENGFSVQAHDVDDTSVVRAKLGMPSALGSCHTALVGGYVIEGHVPASEIKQLLAQKPQALGLAVPGMPIGSPGMEVGNQKPEYDVLLVLADGSSKVFYSYRA